MLTGNGFLILARSLIGTDAWASKRKRGRTRKRSGRRAAIEQQVLARCASQIPACETENRRACDNGPACISLALPCCQALATCDFATFFLCTDEVLSAL